MLDGVSLDQLRALIAAVDEAVFAAARRLRRAQSAVSELVSGLEAQIGVQLFDRTDVTRNSPPDVLCRRAQRHANVAVLKARAKAFPEDLS